MIFLMRNLASWLLICAVADRAVTAEMLPTPNVMLCPSASSCQACGRGGWSGAVSSSYHAAVHSATVVGYVCLCIRDWLRYQADYGAQWYQHRLWEGVFPGEVVKDSVGAALFLCSVGNGSPNAACPDDLTLNCWQSLLALVIPYSPLVTYIFCIKGQKRLFLGFHCLANLFSSGIAVQVVSSCF